MLVAWPTRPLLHAHDQRVVAAPGSFQWWTSSLSTLAHVKKCGKLRRTAGACKGRFHEERQGLALQQDVGARLGEVRAQKVERIASSHEKRVQEGRHRRPSSKHATGLDEQSRWLEVTTDAQQDLAVWPREAQQKGVEGNKLEDDRIVTA